MNEEMWTLLGILITNLAAILSSYIKTRADNLASRRKIENNHTYLSNKIDSLQKTVKHSEVSRELIRTIHLGLSNEAFFIIAANSDITASMQTALNYVQIRIRNFAANYVLSPYRKNKQLVENYLPIELATIEGNIRHVFNDTFTGVKEIEFKGKKRKYTCYDFIKEDNPEIQTETRVLIATLTKNGLEDAEYIAVFKNYIHTYLINLIKGWRKWERL